MKTRPLILTLDEARAADEWRLSLIVRPVLPMRWEQSRWLTTKGINGSPNLTLVRAECGFGAQMEHPLGGPLGWIRCTFGDVGGELYSREPWAEIDNRYRSGYLAYRADGEAQVGVWQWRSAATMPRDYSRFKFENTGVRVARLQSITKADALATGVDEESTNTVVIVNGVDTWNPVGAFAWLWCQRYGRSAGPWSTNPWVWITGVKRVDAQEGKAA